MSHTRADPVSVQRNLILGLLLVLADAAWALLVRQAAAGTDAGMAMASPTMGMRAPLFLVIWVFMMVAMMFPTAAPMILIFHKVQASKRQRGEAFVATWVFVAAYMVVWALSGAAAYSGALAAEVIAARVALSPITAARLGGVVLVAASLYQLTPLEGLGPCKTTVRVRIENVPDNKMVEDGVILDAKSDMGPSGMPEMLGRVTPLPSNQPGLYRFLAETGMAGKWELIIGTRVKGETTVRGAITYDVAP